MLQTVCDICKKVVKGDLTRTNHWCDRCFPFAQKYNEELGKVTGEILTSMEKKIDQMRNEFLRDVVGTAPKKLEAVK
jgi:hypothetical protein